MFLYVIVILLLLIFINLFDYRKKTSGDSFSLLIIFLFFVLIPSLSKDMGIDTLRYQEWFDTLPPLFDFTKNDFNWEPLFCLFMSLLKTISSEWVVAHTFLILFINIPIFYFCKRYVNSKYTFLLIFFLLHFYEVNFEPLRQSCAMAMIIWSLPYLQKKKYFTFYIFSILSVGFHYTAVVSLFIPLACRFKLCSVKVIIACVSIFLLSAIIKIYLGSFIDMLSYSLGYTKFDNYQNHDALNINGVIMTVFIKILPVFAAMYVCIKKGILKDSQLLNGLAIMFVIFMVGRTFVPIFERFTLMFSFAQTACYADAIIGRVKNPCPNNIPRRSNTRLLLISFYIFLAFVYNVKSYFSAVNQFDEPNITRCVPYKSILD